ncbi:hypothetical protein [Streptomyces sp. H27-H5]|uniref:hypothetical protein n=1 Tax=Streptomyces sp. H27-H5 TaxID=2996460 RepID=UPI00226DF5C5|nr:hypothetical protein [Streptomyces sp. H27-H5]MCY0957737.1 hypothetical protein [Streptomyces sp. H27-H5]
MPIQPLPCGSGGAGDAGADVEQLLLCDVLPDGTVAGSAIAVYEYDEFGTAVGPPTFVDPVTGAPYVAQGVLQPCPGDVACGAPVQFCFNSTGQVDQPGRMYDTTLTIAQGFAVQSLINDLVDTPLNIVWEVTDPDGTAFAADLQAALQSQFPGQTVTVTPGAVDPCAGGAADFAVHIECLRLDQDPPNLLQFRYNGGRDLIINPAFLSVPDTGQFAFLKRQDGVSGVATGDVLCTNVANRGWETNDINQSFETWGPPSSTQNVLAATTPPPRGTVVQEINSYGSGAQTEDPGFGNDPNTIWQTFTVPAGGNFTVRVVVGGRASVENIAIKLSTGDVDDAGIGDIINTSVNAGQVTTQSPAGLNDGSGTAGPWTTFNQTVPLTAGVYTLAFTGPQKPAGTGGNAFGGLFTDMRVFQDSPNTIQNFTNDDDTCVVPTSETSTVCEFWAPRCSNGEIVGWYNVADGEDLTNAQFWAQVPAPTCCTGTSDGGSSSVGNLVHTYLVCGTLNGETRTMSRVVVSDQSGGIIADSFIDTDGGPVTPDTWQPGDCSGDSPIVGEFILCDDNGPFIRKLLQNAQGAVTAVVNLTLAGAPYVPVGAVVRCDCTPLVLGEVCIASTDFPGLTLPASAVQACDGTVAYINAATGLPWPNTTGVVVCQAPNVLWEEVLCDGGADDAPFRRVYTLNALGSVTQYDETLDGAPYLVIGPAGRCDCQPFTLGEVCYQAAEAGTARADNWAGATSNPVAGGDLWTNSAFAGAGITVTQEIIGTSVLIANSIETATPANGQTGVTIDLGAPRLNATIQLDVFGSASTERLRNISPPFDSVTGNGVAVLGNTGVDGGPAGDGTIVLTFAGPVQTITYDILAGPPGSGIRQSTITFDEIVPAATVSRAARVQNCDGTTSLTDLETGETSSALGATIVACPADVDVEDQVLCDLPSGVAFLRRYTYDETTGAFVSATDTTLNGTTPYVVVGTAGICTPAVTVERDPEIQVLCDLPTGVAFLRRYTYDEATGAFVSATDTTLNGTTPYAVVGTAGICAPAVTVERDPEIQVLCDLPTGVAFLRRYTYDEATGAFVSATDTTLNGTTPYVVVGTAGICNASQTPATLNSQHKDVVPGNPWVPANNTTGVLTSITYSILSGTGTVTDADGTVIATLPAGLSTTWEAQDENTLTPPTSIASVGGRIYVTWTSR